MALYPNVCIARYSGVIDYGFTCPERGCKYGLYETMPPPEDLECTFKYSGECQSVTAQIAALKSLRTVMGTKLKALEEEIAENEYCG